VGALQKKEYARIWRMATNTEKHFILSHSNATSADFMRAPLTMENYKLGHRFKIAIHQFLGLRTTAEICNVDRCENEEVSPFGEHAIHSTDFYANRHDELKKMFVNEFKGWYDKKLTKRICTTEKSLARLEFSKQDLEKSDVVADIVLTDSSTNHKFV
jgi:hypothetical protein